METLREKTKISLSTIKHLSLFLIGWLGFRLVGLLAGLIIKSFIKDTDSIDYSMTVNIAVYVLIAIALFLTIGKDIKPILKKCKFISSFGWGLVGFIAMIMLLRLWSLIKELLPEPKGLNGNEQGVQDLIHAYPVLTFFMVVILAPICEELTYRVGLFSLVEKKNRILAYVVTCLVFTLLHIQFVDSDFYSEVIAIPTYLIGAFCITFCYDNFGLPSSIICHMTNNLFVYIVTILNLQ